MNDENQHLTAAELEHKQTDIVQTAFALLMAEASSTVQVAGVVEKQHRSSPAGATGPLFPDSEWGNPAGTWTGFATALIASRNAFLAMAMAANRRSPGRNAVLAIRL